MKHALLFTVSWQYRGADLHGRPSVGRKLCQEKATGMTGSFERIKFYRHIGDELGYHSGSGERVPGNLVWKEVESSVQRT